MDEEILKEGECSTKVVFGSTYYFIVKNGKKILHRHDGPAVDGEREKEWWFYGKRHNPNGPARIFWAWAKEPIEKPIFDSNGQRVWNEQWFLNGSMHRIGGPANIIRNGRGYEEWYEHGVLHRIDGPAQTIGGETYYWINGSQFRTQDYWMARMATKAQSVLEMFLKKIRIGLQSMNRDSSAIHKSYLQD